MLKLRKNKKGFTLVELIVVIAIMAVLAGTVAGVTVSQLNKQTNNTAKSEAKSLASDLYNFMIDYKLPETPESNVTGFTKVDAQWTPNNGIDTINELTYAVLLFVQENKQTGNIKVIALADNGTPPVKNGDITTENYGDEYKAGEHKFYAVVYKSGSDLKVRFCCKQKGTGNNQFPYEDYKYGEVLAD